MLTRNWYDVILGRLGARTRPIITFRNGLKFYYDKNRFISDVFSEQPYNILNVTGREVVDVGAFNGDSALYFAMRGAIHVYAFEPMPRTFAIAKANLSLNSFKNISLINKAVGSKDGLILIDPEIESSVSSFLEKFDNGLLIPVISLEHIVQTLKTDRAVLKLDCEGAEFSIILETPREAFRVFSEIVLEYHRDPALIIHRLHELDYIVSITAQYGLVRGLIYARKA